MSGRISLKRKPLTEFVEFLTKQIRTEGPADINDTLPITYDNTNYSSQISTTTSSSAESSKISNYSSANDCVNSDDDLASTIVVPTFHKLPADLNQNWWNSEYTSDVIDVLQEREQRRFAFRKQSPQIDLRGHYVTFIKNVAIYETLSSTTVHLAIYYLDMFMDNHNIAVERLRVVSLVCLLVAAKMEECDTRIPSVREMYTYLHSNHPTGDLAKVEIMLLTFFQWNMLIPTAAHFIEYFIESVFSDTDSIWIDGCARYTFGCHIGENEQIILRSLRDVKQKVADTVLDYLDFITLDAELMQKRPSLMAAVCLASARFVHHIEPIWTDTLTSLTRYTFGELEMEMHNVIANKKQLNKCIVPSPDSGYISATNDD